MGKSKSRLFLLEMIIVILFFAIAAAVCTNIFVQAKMISVQSTDLTNAVSQAQTVADTFRGTQGDLQKTREMLDAEEENDTLHLYFDAQWNRLDDSQSAVYVIRLQPTGDARLSRAAISVKKGEEELYHIDTAVCGGAA